LVLLTVWQSPPLLAVAVSLIEDMTLTMIG
jgi:hypothetical protein